jgi:predicted dehydrogenase
MHKYFLLLLILHLQVVNAKNNEPLQIAVIGLTHTHVHWIFGSEKRNEIKIAGIVETNKALALQYAQQYNYDTTKIFSSNDALLKVVKPQAVASFGTIAQHIQVVKKFAPLGIHIMVEKPLAINSREATQMQQLAQKHQVHLLVNYETTWYPSVYKSQQLINTDNLGALVHAVIHDGHKGPKNIGVNKEFLEWLTDPVQNGGGAITDFGCYGANIATWLMKGKKPNSVTAVTQQLQAANNPLVDDEATILLTYDSCKVTIMPSWNWPIGRKDMELYCRKGVVYADNKHKVRVRIATGYDSFTEENITLNDLPKPYDDPFAYFAAVIQQKIKMQPYDLSSLGNNMIAQEILDAARKSARTGRTVYLR